MSTTSMLSSDGEGSGSENEWTQAQEMLLSRIWDLEVTTYTHANPPFVPSAPPPVLLSRVSKRAIKTAGGAEAWPHTLPQTRKHLLLLARRNAPEPQSPHVAPNAPAYNPMGLLTDAQPGFFNQRYQQLSREQQQDVMGEMLHSPYDERTFAFDPPATDATSPRSPRKSSERIRNNQAAAAASSAFLAAHEQTKATSRPDLMRAGSFGFGVPLTPRKSERSRKSERRESQEAMPVLGIPTKSVGPLTPRQGHHRDDQGSSHQQRNDNASQGRGGSIDEMDTAQGMDKRVAEMMLLPRRSSRLRTSGQPLKRTSSSLSKTD
jgi:hypothetical protein